MSTTNLMTLEIDGILIPVTPDGAHEWTLSTEQVATGYGVTPQALRMVKQRHADELIADVHFTSVTNCDAGLQRVETRWTKLGVITLGFFIRSERAKRFRRMAAELLLEVAETGALAMPAADAGTVAALAEGFRTLACLVERLDARLTAAEAGLEGLWARERGGFAQVVLYRDPSDADLLALLHDVLRPRGGDRVPEYVAESAGALLERARAKGRFAWLLAGARSRPAEHSSWGKYLQRELVGRCVVLDGRRWLVGRRVLNGRSVVEFRRVR